MDVNAMTNKAKNIVIEYFNEKAVEEKRLLIHQDQVFIVWFSKTLANWKALVSTTIPDGRYCEVTYNGVKKETYLDVYGKLENRCIED